MSRYKAILFDMDGTLLPMDLDAFFRGYMAELANAMAFTGVPENELIAAVWNGTKQMVKNDGKTTNREVFWKCFSKELSLKTEEVEPITVEFYANDFHKTKAFVGENPNAVAAIKLARDVAEQVILATNPLFPMVAQEARMSWVGLCGEDFEFVTSYENSHFSKPNPEYYLEICRRQGLKPEECLMIGNDEAEDMMAAAATGMEVFWVTDWAIDRPECVWQGHKGTFLEMMEYLMSMKVSDC